MVIELVTSVAQVMSTNGAVHTCFLVHLNGSFIALDSDNLSNELIVTDMALLHDTAYGQLNQQLLKVEGSSMMEDSQAHT